MATPRLFGPYIDSQAMQSQYLCSLWTLTRADGEVERFTNWDEDLQVDGNEARGLFLSAGGVALSAVSRETGLRTESMTATGVLAGISDERLSGGVYDMAEIVELVVDARWPHINGPMRNVWIVVSVEFSEDHWRWELESETRLLKEVLGSPFSRNCRWSLGTDGCQGISTNGQGIAIATKTYGLSSPLIVSSVSTEFPRQAFKVELNSGSNPLNHQKDTFPFGRVEFRKGSTNGFNAGMGYEILSYDKAGVSASESGEFALYQETVQVIRPGDEVAIEEGCDGEFQTCIDFVNWENFGGDRFIPGAQKARQSAAINWLR